MFLCVQDLTCPGASLLHSASLAAWVKGISAIEANARQYMPAANEAGPTAFRDLSHPRWTHGDRLPGRSRIGGD